MTKEKSLTIVRKVFPRYIIMCPCTIPSLNFFRFDADCVMKNIYETFDSANTGKEREEIVLSKIVCDIIL